MLGWERAGGGDRVMGRQCCRERKLQGPGLAPHPQRGRDHSSRPSLLPVKEPSLCSGFFGLGCEPLKP